MMKQLKFIDNCKNMALAYKISDIIVSASIEPEAFGRVAVEAQSMQKIIIASNIEVQMKLSLMKKLVFCLMLVTQNL